MVRVYFLDSSALVKRYVEETGTQWIQRLTDPATRNQIVIARIAWVEVASALARREREGFLASGVVERALEAFQYDLDTQYQVVELDRGLAMAAALLVRQQPMRAYDAVQLASAQKLYPAFAHHTDSRFSFLTSDDRLLATGRSVGLTADNPNHHP